MDRLKESDYMIGTTTVTSRYDHDDNHKMTPIFSSRCTLIHFAQIIEPMIMGFSHDHGFFPQQYNHLVGSVFNPVYHLLFPM